MDSSKEAPAIPQEEPIITLTLSALRSLLYGDDSLHSAYIQSKVLGDTAKVIIIPVILGQVIAQQDPTEEYFHVEFIYFDSTADQAKQAELWLSFEWKESNARREKIRALSSTERAERLEKASLIEDLYDALSASRLPDYYLRQLASDIAEHWRKKDLTTLITTFDKLDLQISEVLAKYQTPTNDQNQSNAKTGS